MEHKDAKDILFGEIFKERLIIILPIIIGCIFIGLISFSVINTYIRYILMYFTIYCVVYWTAQELAFRLEEYLMLNSQILTQKERIKND